MASNLAVKASAITFGLFMAEAILHYNVGINKDIPAKEKRLKIPPAPEFVELGLTVLLFSVINGTIISVLNKS